ncbi:hypothetical protein ACWD1W_33075 [Streptomyces olivaceoviridis]
MDDAQWLDEVSAQTLPFVARRLLAVPVDLISARGEPHGEGTFAGLPELTLEGRYDLDAFALPELPRDLTGPNRWTDSGPRSWDPRPTSSSGPSSGGSGRFRRRCHDCRWSPQPDRSATRWC